MPYTPQQLAQLAQQNIGKQTKTASTYAQPDDFDAQVNQMPNAQKLTNTERWLYKSLPGVTKWMENTRIMGGTVSEQLDKFNNSFLGKGLQYLDVFAEGLERGIGVVKQMADDPDFDMEELRSAWYAGSLTYDTMNLPRVLRDNNGLVTGVSLPNDLPGTAGLNQARATIQHYMDIGLSPKEALDKARDELYNGLGALSIRAQSNDMWGHVLADPLNLLTGYLKPLEALKSRRLLALGEKLTVGAEELLTKADDVERLAKAASTIEDTLKYTEEAFLLAQNAGDVKRAARLGEELTGLAQKAGKAEDVARYTSEAQELTRIAGSAEEAGQYTSKALQAIGKKQITWADKAAIFLTGGDPFRPTALGQKLRKIPGLGAIGKAFELTPESKAKELLTLISDNIGSKVISRMINDADAEAQFVNYIRRIKKGATGIEFGHGMMTFEGRTVQGFLAGADFDLEKLFQTYGRLETERNLLKIVSEASGLSPEKLLKEMQNTPGVIMELLAKNAPGNAIVGELMQSGRLSEDTLQALAKTLKDVPYNREMFFAEAMDRIETAAMRQAVVQFGVQSKGVVTRWADAMKAAETLAFLRVNPGYPIRNAINNEVTMLARGLFGVMPDQAIDDFWKGMGVIPARLGGAAGPAELAEKMSKADQVIMDALKGGQYGTPEKIKDFFSNLNMGKLDFAKNWGQKFETAARRKAQTLGTMQYLRKHYAPKSVSEYLSSSRILNELESADPELVTALNNAIRSSGAMEGKLDDILGGNLKISVDTLLDSASKKAGVDLRETLGDEVLEYIHGKLPDAIKNGKTDEFKLDLRNQLNKQSEEWFQKNVADIIEDTKARAQLGGPNVWNQKLSEAQDIFWGAHMEHAQRMPEATKLAREAAQAGETKLARALWEQEFEDSRMFYDRAFRRVDAYVQGLEEGTAKLAKQGVKLPFAETRKTFSEWKGMWKDFFTERNRLYKEFFDNVDKGQKVDFNAVRSQVDNLFQANVSKEDEFAQRLDDTIAAMFDNPQVKSAYMNARDELSKLRIADKQDLSDTFKMVEELPAAERQAAWNELWQRRQLRYQQMREVDQRSIAIQQGDPDSMQMFQGAVQGTTEGGGFNINQLANEYGIPSATQTGARNDRRILDTVNKYFSKGQVTSKIPSQLGFDELEKGITRKSRISEIMDYIDQNYEEKFSEYSNVGVRIQDDVYGEKIGDAFQHESFHWVDGEKTLDKTGGVSALDFEQKKYLDRGSNYEGNVIFILGSRSADEGADAGEIVMKSPVVLDIIDDGVFFEKTKYTNVADIPEDVARQAFEARAVEKGLPKPKPKVNPNYIANVDQVLPPLKPIDLGIDQMNYGRVLPALDAVTAEAVDASRKTPLLLKDLPENLQAEMRRIIPLIKNDMAGARYQAVKFGEWRADAALLNYNRRTNFDNWLGTVAPFGFWTTNSAFKWAIESIDRPAMLTNYLRMKKMFATAGLERDGMASRTKGKIRVNLPFAPDWMGEQFIDPLRLALPFDNWMQPFEQMQKEQMGLEGRTERTLDQLLADGKITQQDYDEATTSRAGETWEYASSLTKMNDSEDRYDAWDFATALQAPHAPITWAYNAAMGHPEDIGPFSPMSRMVRNAATMLGVEDWNNSKWNLEAKLRKSMGLTAYDKWDDYRVKRAASDLAGEGKLSPDEAKEAIAVAAMVESGKMTADQAKQESEAYRMAVTRSNKEYTGGGAAFALSLLGISVTGVPKGENELRALQDDFGMAYEKYKKANDSLESYLQQHPEMDQEQAALAWEKANPKLAKEGDALTEFFDAHPEYETRLGLFDKPEVIQQKFFVDQIWKRYNELPKVNQDEVREHLGPEFQNAFLNKETRSTDSIDVETMAVWLKMMNTDPLGGLTADQRLLVNLYGKVQMTEPETAWRVQVFYDTRKQNFPDFYKQQSEYYSQPKNKRKAYLQKHPELQQYFDMRKAFMFDNPDLVSYLTDNEKDIERAKNRARTQNAVPTAREIQIQVPPDVNELLYFYTSTGQPLPAVVLNELDFIGSQYGLTGEQVLPIVQGQYQP